MRKEKCDLCHTEKQRCDECIEVPNEFTKYIEYPVLNPVQAEAYKNLDKECLICTSSTGTGKTLIFEMKMIEWFKQKSDDEIAFVLEPLKMLANEKMKEWSRRYSDIDIIELTGDTKDKIIEKSDVSGSKSEKVADELRKHDVIVTSYEMFSSLTLKNNISLLSNMTLFCVDEIHMLGDKNRGQELEGALIRYFRNYNNKRCKFLGLSATFENNEELEDFFGNFNYDTRTIQSKWSPVKRILGGIETYQKYSQRDNLMARMTYDMLDDYDKVLTVVFSRRATETIAHDVNDKAGKRIAEFHHAGVDRSERKKREKKFKKDDDTKVLVATPTVASGVNLPADGIVLNADYFDGLTKQTKVLQGMTIDQIVGRAGRPQYCDEAKINFTIQRRLRNKLEKELSSDLTVNGTLFDNIDLVLLEELKKRNGAEIDEIEKWLDVSFSDITNPEHRDVAKDIEDLIERGFIKKDGNLLRNTNKGRACAETMLDPHKFDLILSLLSRYDGENPSTSDMLKIVEDFYDSDITAKIENASSRFLDYINYNWMLDGQNLQWRQKSPNYDFQREVKEEFGRISFALEVQGKSVDLINAISEMLPYNFYKLKKKLNDIGIKNVGEKRLLTLWFNGLRPDDLSNPPQSLSLPKTLDNIITIQPIDEIDREVLSFTQNGINKIYPRRKWRRDKSLIEEIYGKDDDSLDVVPNQKLKKEVKQEKKIDKDDSESSQTNVDDFFDV